MKIRACAVSALVVLVALLIALAASLAPSPATATPGFARQTGLSCAACHSVFPELTPFGRRFKLNAYVFTNVKQLEPVSEQAQKTLSLSDLPPLSVQLQGSNTWLGKALPDNGPSALGTDRSQQNTTQFPLSVSSIQARSPTTSEHSCN